MHRFILPVTSFFAALLFSLGALAANPQVEMKTSQGTILIELYPEKAPLTVANFLRYVREDFYAGTLFHRVIDGFMIQGGGFASGMKEKPTHEPIQNEAKNGLKNDAGTIAMARTGDPHSASAQFFINLKPNNSLNYPNPDGWGYAVFGKVIKGFEIVEKIGKTRTGNVSFYQDVPVTPVMIESVRLVNEKNNEKK